MAVFDPTTHKIIRTGTGNLGDAGQVDPRVMLTALLNSMGFHSVTVATSAPADKKTLWWNKDAKTFNRYNPAISNWSPLTPDLYSLHLLHRAFTAVVQDVNAADDDWLMFWDKSLGESKGMTIANLKASLGVGPGWTLMSTTSVAGSQPYLEVTLPTQVYNEICVVLEGMASTSELETRLFSRFIQTNGAAVVNGEAGVPADNPSVSGYWGISSQKAEPWRDVLYIHGNNVAALRTFQFSFGSTVTRVPANPNNALPPFNIDRLRFYASRDADFPTTFPLTSGVAKLFMR